MSTCSIQRGAVSTPPPVNWGAAAGFTAVLTFVATLMAAIGKFFGNRQAYAVGFRDGRALSAAQEKTISQMEIRITNLERRNNDLETQLQTWQDRLYEERKIHLALLQKYIEQTGDISVLTTANAELKNTLEFQQLENKVERKEQ